MPYVHVNISKDLTPEKLEELRDAIAGTMHLIPGKTRTNTMIHLSAGEAITMGDDGEPAIFMEARLYKEAPVEAKEAFAKAVTDIFVEKLEIPANRVYMNIIELDHWASGGNYR